MAYDLSDKGIMSPEFYRKLKQSLKNVFSETNADRSISRLGSFEAPHQIKKVWNESLKQEPNHILKSVEHFCSINEVLNDARKETNAKEQDEHCSNALYQVIQEPIYANLLTLRDEEKNETSKGECQHKFQELLMDNRSILSPASNHCSYKYDIDKNTLKDDNLQKNIEANESADEKHMNIPSAREQIMLQNISDLTKCVGSSDKQTLLDKSTVSTVESEPVYENLPSYLQAINSALNRKNKVEKIVRKEFICQKPSEEHVSPDIISVKSTGDVKSNPGLHVNLSELSKSTSFIISKNEQRPDNLDFVDSNLNTKLGIRKSTNSSATSADMNDTQSYHNLTYNMQTSSTVARPHNVQKFEVPEVGMDPTDNTSYENATYDIHVSCCENEKVEKEYLQKHAVINRAILDATKNNLNPSSIEKTRHFLQTSNKWECTANQICHISSRDFNLQTNILEENFRRNLVLSEKQKNSYVPQCESPLSKKEVFSNSHFEGDLVKQSESSSHQSDVRKTESCSNLAKKKYENKLGSELSHNLCSSEKLRKVNILPFEDSVFDQFSKVSLAEKVKKTSLDSLTSSNSFSDANNGFHLKLRDEETGETVKDLITDSENKSHLKQKSLRHRISSDVFTTSDSKFPLNKSFSGSTDCNSSKDQKLTALESTFIAKCKISHSNKNSIQSSSENISFSSPLEIPKINEPRSVERKCILTKSSSFKSETAYLSPKQDFLSPITSVATAEAAAATSLDILKLDQLSKEQPKTKFTTSRSKSLNHRDECQLKHNPDKSKPKLCLSQIFHDNSFPEETYLVDERKDKTEFRRRMTKSENNLSPNMISLEKPKKHSKRTSTEGSSKGNTSKGLSTDAFDVSLEEGVLHTETSILEEDFELKELRRRSITKSPGIFPPLDTIHSMSVPKTSQRGKYRQKLNVPVNENQTVGRERTGRRSLDANTEAGSFSILSPLTSRGVGPIVPSSQPISRRSTPNLNIRVSGSNPDLLHLPVTSPLNGNVGSTHLSRESVPLEPDSPKARRKLSFDPSEDDLPKSLSRFHSLPLLSRRRLHLSPENCLPTNLYKTKIQMSYQKQVTFPDTPKSSTRTVGMETEEQCLPDSKSPV